MQPTITGLGTSSMQKGEWLALDLWKSLGTSKLKLPNYIVEMAARATALGRTLTRVAGRWRTPLCRGLSTSRPVLAGIDPKEEAIYTDEHWEMRQVHVLNKL